MELVVLLHRVEFAAIEMSVGDFGNAGIFLRHNYTNIATENRFALAITDDIRSSRNNEWKLSVHVGSDQFDFPVPTATDAAVTINFDADLNEVVFGYEILDIGRTDSFAYGPFTYQGSVFDLQVITLTANAIDEGRTDVKINEWSLLRTDNIPPGDFNHDGVVDIEDLNRISNEIRGDGNNLDFDLVADGVVNIADRNFWITQIAKTWFGDSNLDGEFNSGDLVAVFAAGEYDDDTELNSTWAEGDWDGDGDFNSRDLVIAFQDGGYEAGPRAVAVVPEPTSPFVLLFGLIALAQWRRT